MYYLVWTETSKFREEACSYISYSSFHGFKQASFSKTYENTLLLDTFSSVESSNIMDTTNYFVEVFFLKPKTVKTAFIIENT